MYCDKFCALYLYKLCKCIMYSVYKRRATGAPFMLDPIIFFLFSYCIRKRMQRVRPLKNLWWPFVETARKGDISENCWNLIFSPFYIIICMKMIEKCSYNFSVFFNIAKDTAHFIFIRVYDIFAASPFRHRLQRYLQLHPHANRDKIWALCLYKSCKCIMYLIYKRRALC